jgi:hypothetical protein
MKLVQQLVLPKAMSLVEVMAIELDETLELSMVLMLE